VRSFAALTAVAGALLAVLPAGVANAAANCDFNAGTGAYSCSGQQNVKLPSDVVGARVYTGTYYEGDRLTIWAPKDCPKDGWVNHQIRLNNTQWARNIGSVQPFGQCAVWLAFDNGGREGPYEKDNSNVADIGRYTVEVQLS
jgi:hypothetical protein